MLTRFSCGGLLLERRILRQPVCVFPSSRLSVTAAAAAVSALFSSSRINVAILRVINCHNYNMFTMRLPTCRFNKHCSLRKVDRAFFSKRQTFPQSLSRARGLVVAASHHLSAGNERPAAAAEATQVVVDPSWSSVKDQLRIPTPRGMLLFFLSFLLSFFNHHLLCLSFPITFDLSLPQRWNALIATACRDTDFRLLRSFSLRLLDLHT